jgi:nickel-type superoxide dismutase maturation protease
MIRFIKVTGDSLYPTFRQGDFVLISKIPFRFKKLKEGDVIVFEQPIYGVMIKRISQVFEGGKLFYVLGTDEFSVDSRQFGSVRLEALLGKVIWHIPRPRG